VARARATGHVDARSILAKGGRAPSNPNKTLRPRISPICRRVGNAIAALAVMSTLTTCAPRDSADNQLQRQVKRAQECRQLQDKLVGDQVLTRERAQAITKAMDQAGCNAHLQAQ
jgi:transposase